MKSLTQSLLSLFFVGLLFGVCEAKKQHQDKAGQSTRAALPYLKYRNGDRYAAGASLLSSVAWHPTANVCAVAGGPAGSEILIYSVAGDASGAHLNNLSSVSVGSNFRVNTIAWSPNGNYLAVGGYGVASSQLRIYSYANQALTELTTATWGSTGTSSVNSLAWTPNGNYLAAVGSGQTDGKEVIVYYFAPTASTILTSSATVDLGSGVDAYAVAWHPTNYSLAIGSNATNALQVYQFSASAAAGSLTQKSSIDFGGSTSKLGGLSSFISALAWSPNGSYLAAGGFCVTNNNQIKIYRTAPNGTLTAISDAVASRGNFLLGTEVDALAWDPNGSYLLTGAYGVNDLNELVLFSFDGEQLYQKRGSRLSFGSDNASYVTSLAWQSNRKYVLVGGYLPYNSKELWLMEFITSPIVA